MSVDGPFDTGIHGVECDLCDRTGVRARGSVQEAEWKPPASRGVFRASASRSTERRIGRAAPGTLAVMSIPVVALYAPLNAFFNIALASNVVRYRMRGVADADKALQVAVRIHGNNAEFVPLALVMMLIAELSGGASLWLHIAGGLLLVARVSHAVGMPLKAPNPLRSFGVVATWGTIVALGVYCLVLRAR